MKAQHGDGHGPAPAREETAGDAWARHPLRDHPLIRAAWRRPVPYTPVWFMRQAGSYIPEHKRLMDRYGLLTLTKTPELCTRVTLLPIERLGVDAAVMFADIILPLGGMGMRFHYDARGPVIENPVRGDADVRRLTTADPRETVPYILEAVRNVKQALGTRTPVIGFSGGPFTLAAYMIEGGPSADGFPAAKALLREAPGAWHALMERLTASIIAYLDAKVEAGADVVQLFDTWAGVLDRGEYEQAVLPYTRAIFDHLEAAGRPRIHFAVRSGHLLDPFAVSGADVIGVDHRTPLDDARAKIGDDLAVQGNLDPACLLDGAEAVTQAASDVLRRAGGRPGHIFNLGHRVPLEADPAVLRQLVDWVHDRSGADA